MIENKNYLTYAETAEILDIKLCTLYSYVSKGKLIQVKRPGKKSVFDKDYIMSIALGEFPIDNPQKPRQGEKIGFQEVFAKN